jgi:hypothetical protein
MMNLGLPPRGGKGGKKKGASKAGSNLNSTMNTSVMSGYHSILLKRSILSSSASRDMLRSLDAKPRELYTDAIIKNSRHIPSPLSYNT